MEATTQIVALGGGVGTRFWPVSRHARPKQLLRLVSDATLLTETFDRVRAVSPSASWWMVVGREHASACQEAVPEIPGAQVLVEPVRRNTAAAIGLAAVHLEKAGGDPTMIVLPADHTIGEPEAFRQALVKATSAAQSGNIVVLGITPSRPETGYGYVERGQPTAEGGYQVKRFLEKPNRARAEELFSAGGYLWNAGIFVMRVSTYLDALAKYLPETRDRLAVLSSVIGTPKYDSTLAEVYATLEAISIDYGVMEHLAAVTVVPVDCGWSDIGSWDALAKVIPADPSGNRVRGRAVVKESRDCVIYATDGHLVGVVGLDNLVVVHTEDATLVLPASRAQEVRGLVAAIEDANWSEYL